MKNKAIKRSGLALALMLGVISFLPRIVGAQESVVVATGLNGPMGVLATPDGNVWVIDAGVGGDTEIEFPDLTTGALKTVRLGDTSQIVRIDPDGSKTVVAVLPSLVISPEESFGGARLAMLDDALYATSGGWIAGAGTEPIPKMATLLRIEDGESTEVVNTWDLESSDNPDGFHLESHPFGLTVGPDGHLWMTDAASNTLLKVDPASGQMEVVATFDGVPSPIPNAAREGAMESDPVPTGVTFDQDGNLYVALLPGIPFLPGSGKVVKVTAEGAVSDYATGLTMLTDLRTGPDGQLYAVSFGQFTEQGPVPNSGAIVRIKEGAASEEIVTGLSFPTSIAFNASGDAYVTINGVGAPGSGEVVLYKALAMAHDH